MLAALLQEPGRGVDPIAWADRLTRLTALDAAAQVRVVQSLLIILVLWIVRLVVLRVVNKRTRDVRSRYQWKKTTAYASGMLAVLLVARVWYEGIHSLATFLGLLGAGLAIALRDPVANFAGWAFILWRRPFTVGDRIQIMTHSGDVIDQRLFAFTLLEIGNWVGADQSTGRVIHVPNGKVFVEPVANYSQGLQYIWNEIPVRITFESDWRQAKELLLEIVNRHCRSFSDDAQQKMLQASQRFMIFYTTFTPTVYTSVKEWGVLLTIRYLCEPRRRRSTEQAVWEDVLSEFAGRPDIAFAYPTQRFFSAAQEGESGGRPGAPEGRDG
jgi:small-conductance mechanosensitive channel